MDQSKRKIVDTDHDVSSSDSLFHVYGEVWVLHSDPLEFSSLLISHNFLDYLTTIFANQSEKCLILTKNQF